MITITQKEENVFNKIKGFDSKSNGDISRDSLKNELCTGSFHEYDLIQVLNSLSSKHLIDFDGADVKSVNNDIEFNTVSSKSDLKELELNKVVIQLNLMERRLNKKLIYLTIVLRFQFY